MSDINVSTVDGIVLTFVAIVTLPLDEDVSFLSMEISGPCCSFPVTFLTVALEV